MPEKSGGGEAANRFYAEFIEIGYAANREMEH
jgi:hypothetical protein